MASKQYAREVNELIEHVALTWPSPRKPYAGMEHFWVVRRILGQQAAAFHIAGRLFRTVVTAQYIERDNADDEPLTRQAIKLRPCPDYPMVRGGFGRLDNLAERVRGQVYAAHLPDAVARRFDPLAYAVHVEEMVKNAENVCTADMMPSVFTEATLGYLGLFRDCLTQPLSRESSMIARECN